MVNIWPFGRSDDDSIVAFEKSISALQTKIARATTKRDFLRKASRRTQALWLLYTSFAYILFVLITFLVTGRDALGAFEYTCLAGGPLVIIAVRALLLAFYNYRISSADNHLSALETQRESTIEKFKTATKYNTTQAVLERYGAAPSAASAVSKVPSAKTARGSPAENNKPLPKQAVQQQQRTGFAPPATANIQKPPSHQKGSYVAQQDQPLEAGSPTLLATSESFAPNAFDIPPRTPQYASATGSSGAPIVAHAWYDRLMDALLGEDESKSINRIALICSKCKLVNGVAPPGVKTIEDIGQWRCAECKEWNGSRDQIQKILEEVGAQGTTDPVKTESQKRTLNVAADEVEHGEETAKLERTD